MIAPKYSQDQLRIIGGAIARSLACSRTSGVDWNFVGSTLQENGLADVFPQVQKTVMLLSGDDEVRKMTADLLVGLTCRISEPRY